MAIIAPLNLEFLFINTFAGTTLIFVTFALLLVAGMSARFRMSNVITGTVIALFALMLGSIASWLYFITVIVLFLIIGYTAARLYKG